MRRVAVTGASGLVGTVLTAALEKRGDRVVPIGRRPPAGGVAGDLAARRIDEAALEGVDAHRRHISCRALVAAAAWAYDDFAGEIATTTSTGT